MLSMWRHCRRLNSVKYEYRKFSYCSQCILLLLTNTGFCRRHLLVSMMWRVFNTFLPCFYRSTRHYIHQQVTVCTVDIQVEIPTFSHHRLLVKLASNAEVNVLALTCTIPDYPLNINKFFCILFYK